MCTDDNIDDKYCLPGSMALSRFFLVLLVVITLAASQQLQIGKL